MEIAIIDIMGNQQDLPNSSFSASLYFLGRDLTVKHLPLRGNLSNSNISHFQNILQHPKNHPYVWLVVVVNFPRFDIRNILNGSPEIRNPEGGPPLLAYKAS